MSDKGSMTQGFFFGYTSEQRIFRDAVSSFAKKEIAPYAREWDESETCPQEMFKKLGELGYLGTGFPEDVGGSGGGTVEYTILLEEMAKVSAGVVLGIYVHTGLACAAIHHLGSDDQKRAYLAEALKVLTLGRIGAAAFASGIASEPCTYPAPSGL